MKWFTKGEIFTSCFNVDLDRSASKKEMCAKMSVFKACQKTFPPLLMTINRGRQGVGGGGGGGAKKK